MEEGDEDLSTLSIACEEEYQLPLLRAAKEATGDLTLLASPWSPPAHREANRSMDGGGKLKPSCRKLWADYIAAYLSAYREKGFAHDFLTIQNEPKAVQRWDSCIYTPQEEREFAEDYLAGRAEREKASR